MFIGLGIEESVQGAGNHSENIGIFLSHYHFIINELIAVVRGQFGEVVC